MKEAEKSVPLLREKLPQYLEEINGKAILSLCLISSLLLLQLCSINETFICQPKDSEQAARFCTVFHGVQKPFYRSSLLKVPKSFYDSLYLRWSISKNSSCSLS